MAQPGFAEGAVKHQTNSVPIMHAARMFIVDCVLLGGDECSEEDTGRFAERPPETGRHVAAARKRTGCDVFMSAPTGLQGRGM